MYYIFDSILLLMQHFHNFSVYHSSSKLPFLYREGRQETGEAEAS